MTELTSPVSLTSFQYSAQLPLYYVFLNFNQMLVTTKKECQHYTFRDILESWSLRSVGSQLGRTFDCFLLLIASRESSGTMKVNTQPGSFQVRYGSEPPGPVPEYMDSSTIRIYFQLPEGN